MKFYCKDTEGELRVLEAGKNDVPLDDQNSVKNQLKGVKIHATSPVLGVVEPVKTPLETSKESLEVLQQAEELGERVAALLKVCHDDLKSTLEGEKDA